MKKLLFLFLVVVSFKVTAQNQGFYVVQWDDTVTVRNVENIRADMIKNRDYRPVTLPTGLDENIELFLFEGVKTMPVSDQRYFDLRMETYFIDSFNLDLGWDSTRLCGIQWIETPTDTTNIFASVEAIKAEYNSDILELQKQVEYLAYYVYYVDAEVHSLIVPTKLADMIPNIRNYIAKWWMNFINLENIKDAIRNEENPDIDAGWTGSTD